MNRRKFLTAMMATIPMVAVAKRIQPEETLQQAIDRGGLIEGKSYVVSEPLIVTNNHDFRLLHCKLKITGNARRRQWMDMTQRTRPKGTIVIEGCTIDFGEVGHYRSVKDYGMYDGSTRGLTWHNEKILH